MKLDTAFEMSLAVGLLGVSLWAGARAEALQQAHAVVSSSLPPKVLADPNRERLAVSVDYRADDILVDLLPPERILGLSLDADNREISNAWQSAALIPLRLELTVERLLSVQPEVVIVGGSGPEEALKMLESNGIAVVRQNGANTLAEIQENIAIIAAGVGAPEAGLRLVERMKAKLERVRQAALTVSRPRVLYLYSGGASVETTGSGTYLSELIEIAGGKNVAAEAGVVGWAPLSLEQAAQWNPEIIVYGDSSARDQAVAFMPPPSLERHPVWRELSAVRSKNVCAMPGRLLFCASHNTAEAARLLAIRLHPELATTLEPDVGQKP